MRKYGGYLTVYLSLSLALILSFILTMVEGARLHAVRMEAECISDIGMNSVLAEFHRELLEQYDLLFVDMSYGTPSAIIENSSEHLRSYMEHNCKGMGKGQLRPVSIKGLAGAFGRQSSNKGIFPGLRL